MWAIIDSDDVIAYHAEKRVCENYLLQYQENHEDAYIIKIKRKDLEEKYDEKYLVKYGENYIQYKYLEIMDLDIAPILDNLYAAHDTLHLLMEERGKRDIKRLLKADKIILSEIEKINLAGYDIDRLDDRKAEIERFKSRMEE